MELIEEQTLKLTRWQRLSKIWKFWISTLLCGSVSNYVTNKGSSVFRSPESKICPAWRQGDNLDPWWARSWLSLWRRAGKLRRKHKLRKLGQIPEPGTMTRLDYNFCLALTVNQNESISNFRVLPNLKTWSLEPTNMISLMFRYLLTNSLTCLISVYSTNTINLKCYTTGMSRVLAVQCG